MSPKDLSARMQQVAARGRPGSADEGAPVQAQSDSVSAGEPRTPGAARTHRVTVDLDDDAYALLRCTALDWFVPGSTLLRALIAEMAADPDLAERVRIRAQQR